MASTAGSVDQYIKELPPDRREAMTQLRNTILKNIPKGFKEVMGHGMIGYVVPHELYAEGYHCNPDQPVPFIFIASQKNYISLHHMGIYSNPSLLKWFSGEYARQVPSKLDMGKGCIRFKKPEQIPYKLIAALTKKITVRDWLAVYDGFLKSRQK